ncbi:craniofacial development protein 2-like [Acyrthosiphon pisum]|uniref:Craniofacial development protein 2-like n=1 Tax=Acyrthosiphon pisum TaxID=7029 RepID=A0A8R2B2I4_ACYPI|nr:craniofacial development protein 2-like [Acyrthosiphon pisum]|eukprot:XP_008178654.1 PREDICTED: craniofacial development protein 2-like [Acyrthosiphon pisum]
MITKQRLILPRNVEITDLCIGTWNVRSMYRTGTLTTVVSCLERYRLDITAVQEIRRDGSGSIKSQGNTILYSGGEKHERGVGFIIKDKVLPNVVKFESISDRIWYMEFKCRWFNIVIVNCYAPTEDKSEGVKNAFYDELDRVCD